MARAAAMTGLLEQPPSDATLVTAALAGDREAFADIYDRYALRMHDFCLSMLRSRDAAADAMQDTFVIAADRLVQLRDPDRLRPWLYAVARSVALKQLRGRRREQVAADVDAPADDFDAPHDAARRDELRALLWDAARGLSDRDRMVLDLHLRHGLEGQELATALGVTENNANVTLSRVRDRVERSLGAFLVARLGSRDCTELAALLRDWDGRFSPLVRKRVARHVDGCDVCDARRAALVSPWQLLGTVPLVALPPELRDRVLGRIDLTSGRRRPRDRRAARLTAAALVAVAATAGAVAAAQSIRDHDTAPAVAPLPAPAGPSSAPLLVAPASAAPSTGLDLTPPGADAADDALDGAPVVVPAPSEGPAQPSTPPGAGPLDPQGPPPDPAGSDPAGPDPDPAGSDRDPGPRRPVPPGPVPGGPPVPAPQ